MSLLTDAMVDCVIMDKTTVADGYGGVTTTWADGAKIKAAIVANTPSADVRAQQLGITTVYTVTTERTVVLRFNDVIKRSSDSKLFRVTSNGDDKATPVSATLDMRVVTAEAWSNG